MNKNSVHLSFDKAAYTEETEGPCQILARSFYSPGIGYCVAADDYQGMIYAVPVPKNAVKAAMEKGVFVWVSRIQPMQIDAGSAINLQLKFSLSSDRYAPLICSEEELQQILPAQPYYPSLRLNGTKAYRFNPKIGHGSNLRGQRSEAL